MHIVLIRHGSRIDKTNPGISPIQSEVSIIPATEKINKNLISLLKPVPKQTETDETDFESFKWLSNFDPPLNEVLASNEMESSFKKIATNVLGNHKADKIMIHSSPYNRCIQTSELLLNRLKNCKQVDNKTVTKLRVDQGLSEWLNENYNLKYLPPNDDGYSMINNVNAYLNQSINENDLKGDFSLKTRNQLRDVKDPLWSYNQLGHCGEYGESASNFTRRCFYYLINLLQFYYTRQNTEADKHTVVFIISHGAVISTLLQILLGRSVFNEIPLCSPIYFKQSEKRRSVFKLRDYDFNLFNLLSPSSDQEFYKILDTPIDLTRLDPDNLRSELTIGTTGYTTIIQSIPKKLDITSPKSNSKKTGRKRRNTINIGEKENDKNENEGIESLKQTRSSRQLYLLNKDTNDEKVIDLDKLHSYFGSGTDTETESENELDKVHSNNIISINDFDDNGKSLTDNVFKGSIASLSSFNEENKSKFQLNDKNFYSKAEPIKSDPYSHFFLSRSSTVDDEMSDYDGISISRRSSSGFSDNKLRPGFKMTSSSNNNDNDCNDNNDDYPNNKNKNSSIIDISTESDIESDEGNESDDNNILSFGTKFKLQRIIDKQENIIPKEKVTLEDNAVINGTFKNILVGSHSKLDSIEQENGQKPYLGPTNNSSSGVGLSGLNNKSHDDTIKLVVPKLISTRNMELLVRGGESDREEEEYSRNKEGFSKLGKFLLGKQGSFNALQENWINKDADPDYADGSDESDSDGGWFGGFSR